jgi:EAL domain-containing protein (putative c-di-GMP-specific phosphodiesterase class I)
MDDFGTGYSSLSYLRAFPFDKIKIDRSFMRDLESRGDSLAIIKAVREQGCNEVQGFLFSPPLEAGDVLTLLARESQPIPLRRAS